MLVTILPFFLAVHVADDVYYSSPDWHHYGPEFTYDVLVNMSLANVVRETDNICSMIASELKCRPKGSDSLSCRFTNGQIVRPNIDDRRCSNARNFVPISDRFVNSDPFEVRFNSKGIENLIVPRSIPRWRLDMIKDIIAQLNIGFELGNEETRFVTHENSNIGYCELEVRMSRAGYGRGSGMAVDGAFEIVLATDRRDVTPLSRATLVIQKVRQPKKCSNKNIYFFGNHEDFSHGNRETFMDMTSSISHIYISHREIHSYTESAGIMRTLRSPRTMQLQQKISLTLRSIDPARSALPEISNRASTSLYAYTHLERIPEYK